MASSPPAAVPLCLHKDQENNSRPSTARSDSDSLDGLVSEIRCKRPEGTLYASPSPSRGTSLAFSVHPRSHANKDNEGALVVSYQNTGLDLIEALEQDKLETIKQQAAQATVAERIAEELKTQRELAAASEAEALRNKKEREALAAELAMANDKLSKSFYTTGESTFSGGFPTSPPLSTGGPSPLCDPAASTPQKIMVTSGTNTSPARTETFNISNVQSSASGPTGSFVPANIKLTGDTTRASQTGIGRLSTGSPAGIGISPSFEKDQSNSLIPIGNINTFAETPSTVKPIATQSATDTLPREADMSQSSIQRQRQLGQQRMMHDNPSVMEKITPTTVEEASFEDIPVASQNNMAVQRPSDNPITDILVLDRSSDRHGGQRHLEPHVEAYIVRGPNNGDNGQIGTLNSLIHKPERSVAASSIATQTEFPQYHPPANHVSSQYLTCQELNSEFPQQITCARQSAVDVPPDASFLQTLGNEQIQFKSVSPTSLNNQKQAFDRGTNTEENIIVVAVERPVVEDATTSPLSNSHRTDSATGLESSLGRGSPMTSAQREAMGIEDITFEVSSYAQTDFSGPLHPPPDPARASVMLFSDLIRERDEQARASGNQREGGGGRSGLSAVRGNVWSSRHGGLDKSGLNDDEGPINTEDEEGYEGEAGFIHHGTDVDSATYYANATVDSDIETSGYLYRSKLSKPSNAPQPSGLGLGLGRLNIGGGVPEEPLDATSEIPQPQQRRRHTGGEDQKYVFAQNLSPHPVHPRISYEEAPDEDWLRALAAAEAVPRTEPHDDRAVQTPSSSGMASAPSVPATAGPSPEMAEASRSRREPTGAANDITPADRATTVQVPELETPEYNCHHRLDSTTDGEYQPPTDEESLHVRFDDHEQSQQPANSFKIPNLNVQAAQKAGAAGSPSARVADTARFQPTTGRPGGMVRHAPPMSPTEGDVTDRRHSHPNSYVGRNDYEASAPPLPSWVPNASDPQGAAETSRDTLHLDRNQLVALLADIRSQLGSALAAQAMYRARSERFATQLTNRTTELGVVSQFLEQSQTRNVELARMLNDMTERASATTLPSGEQTQQHLITQSTTNVPTQSPNAVSNPSPSSPQRSARQQQQQLSRANSFKKSDMQNNTERGFERSTSTLQRGGNSNSFYRSPTGFVQGQHSPTVAGNNKKIGTSTSKAVPAPTVGSPSGLPKRLSVLKSPAANLSKSLTNGGAFR